MAQPRPYRQQARAESSAATADRILEATTALVMERWVDEITLELIAERSGVNVRTVIRRFGSRDAVVQAMVDRFRTRPAAAPVLPLPHPGDVRGAIRLLCEYYERDGAFLLRGLVQETRFDFLRTNFDGTRARHREWVSAAFAPQLAALAPRARESTLLKLAAVTWATTWSFLRRDSKLDRDQTEKALRELAIAIVGGG